jgi:hypothetical protein
MDVSEAVAAAKRRLNEVFKDEPIVDVGLEEVEGGEDSDWYITLGFNRSWHPLSGIAATLGAAPQGPRIYKTVHMSKDGKFMSIKNREPS